MFMFTNTWYNTTRNPSYVREFEGICNQEQAIYAKDTHYIEKYKFYCESIVEKLCNQSQIIYRTLVHIQIVEQNGKFVRFHQ